MRLRFPLFLFFLALAGCSRGGQGQVAVVGGDGVTRLTVNGQTIELKETEKEVIREAFKTGAAPRIVVDVFAGKVVVEVGADDAVEAELTRIAVGKTNKEAKANLLFVDVQSKQDGDTVSISARRAAAKDDNQNYENLLKQHAPRGADSLIRAPRGADLTLKTALGDIHIGAIAGRVEAVTSSGAITVAGCKGDVKIMSDFGNLIVDGPSTAVVAMTKIGDLSVKGAVGPVDLSSGFGPITVVDAADRVAAKTGSGDVKIKGAKGALTATTGFGAIDVDGAADVQIETKSGDIIVKGAVGAVSARSGLGNVVVEHAPAGAILETVSGAIRLRAAKGVLVLTSGYGAIDADVSQATVRATAKSGGDIKVRGALAEGEHSLHTGYGKVMVTLPADSRFYLDAATNGGAITTRFALARTDDKIDRRLLRGAVGDASKVILHLSVDRGDIEVRKE
jgi:hypothetical protein